jgi:tripeptide aminopeptidase
MPETLKCTIGDPCKLKTYPPRADHGQTYLEAIFYFLPRIIYFQQHMFFMTPVLDRFIRYVQVDTQADPHSNTFPSTAKQKDLAQLLVKELKEMGVEDAHMDEWGYVYATIPANTDKKDVPVICFCSHMDTSPDCSGTGVKPIVHRDYRGQDIVLPDDPSQVLRLSEHPDLAHQMGNDIVTASGTTLLGADDKAGVAEIMAAAEFLLKHPEIKHGAIKILFTPDEEIGRGTDHVDLNKLGAHFGYTLDGESRGSLENETFSARMATVVIHGVAAHPGYAKGKMEHATRIMCKFMDRLPQTYLSPESTEGKQGFIHPTHIEGGLERCEATFILRDFNMIRLENHETLLRHVLKEVLKAYPRSTGEVTVVEQYRNMKEVLDKHPQVTEYAIEAIRRAGLEPKLSSVRGGTDGSRLSFMGLPCPNLFTGEHAYHSKVEWVSVQDMEKAVEVIVQLCQIWEEAPELQA